jgi:prepilin-type N-terminal cleavage/methylation domain-containing protein
MTGKVFCHAENFMNQKIGDILSIKIQDSTGNNEDGFSLVEVIIAMVILLIVLLGVFITFAYAVNYNAGNSARSQALTVLQQQVELMRSAKFTPQITDSSLLGGTHAPVPVTTVNGNKFIVTTAVDNDPSTAAIEDDTAKPKPTIKEISVTVTFAAPTPGWQTAVPAKIIMRRVRAN